MLSLPTATKDMRGFLSGRELGQRPTGGVVTFTFQALSVHCVRAETSFCAALSRSGLQPGFEPATMKSSGSECYGGSAGDTNSAAL
jgi:hypothetical protein